MENWLQYIRFGFKNVFVYSKQIYKKNLFGLCDVQCNV